MCHRPTPKSSFLRIFVPLCGTFTSSDYIPSFLVSRNPLLCSFYLCADPLAPCSGNRMRVRGGLGTACQENPEEVISFNYLLPQRRNSLHHSVYDVLFHCRTEIQVFSTTSMTYFQVALQRKHKPHIYRKFARDRRWNWLGHVLGMEKT